MAFSKTPANVLTLGMDLSPIGIFKAAHRSINGKTTVSQFLDEMARGLTGTALLGIGMLLRSASVITGGADEDKDKAALDKITGNAPYSIMGKYSYDWAQPFSVPFILGATIYDSISGENDWLTSVVNVAAKTGDTFLDLSVMQNVSNLFGGYGSTSENILQQLAGMPLRMLPSALRQIAQTGDGTVRSTYSDTFGGTLLNQAKAYIPSLANTLPASVDSHGNAVERSDNILLRGLMSFLSPGSYSPDNSTDADKEMYRLYEATGDKSMFPIKAPSTLEHSGISYTMTDKEKEWYAATLGQTSAELKAEAIASEEYKKLTDAEKVKVFAQINEYATDAAKRKVVTDQGAEYTSDWDNESKMTDLSTTMSYKTAFNSMLKSYTKASDADKAYTGKDSDSMVLLHNLYGGLTTTQKSESTEEMDSTGFAKVMAAMDVGISATQYYKAYDQYKLLNKMADTKSGMKAKDFTAFLDQEMPELKDNQKAVLKENFGFYAQNRADDAKYQALTASDISSESASKIYDTMAAIVPPAGKDQATARQLRTEIAKISNLNESQKLAVVEQYTTKETYAKYESLSKYGVKVDEYIKYINLLEDISIANGGTEGQKTSYTKAEVKAALNASGINANGQSAIYATYGYKS